MPKVKKTKSRCVHVPYARGFKLPSPQKKRQAVGKDTDLPEYNPDPYQGFDFFPPIPAPQSIDDWLAQYAENGQTFGQFVRETPWLSCRKKKSRKMDFEPLGKTILQKYPEGKIYLLPIGDFNKEHCVNFDDLIEFAQIYLGIPVKALPKVPLEVEQNGKVKWKECSQNEVNGNESTVSKRVSYQYLKKRFNSSTQHYQIRVNEALLNLRKLLPDDALCTIGLTMSDLYGDDPDLFVAGMAGGNLGVGIFSFYRYDPSLSFSTEDWFDVEHLDNVEPLDRKITILQRSCKLLVHEINHLLGLDHCIFYECCMNGSGHLEEDFRQPIHLCPVDLRKLQTLVGFDILTRYQQLAGFYEKHNMEEEVDWVRRRIQAIRNKKS